MWLQCGGGEGLVRYEHGGGRVYVTYHLVGLVRSSHWIVNVMERH